MSELAIVVLAAAGAAIRPVTAFLTRYEADGGPLGAIAGIVLAGVAAGGAALTNLGGVGDDWKSVVLAFATALTAAGAASAQTWSGRAVEWIHDKTDEWVTTVLG